MSFIYRQFSISPGQYFKATIEYAEISHEEFTEKIDQYRKTLREFFVWLALFVIGVTGIICFRKSFLKADRLSKETVVLTKAENITADYYFTYFSLFVISFFGVDPTKLKDILIFAIIMVLIIWVYVANEMYFVNPVLNIVGYKSFSIVYHKSFSANNAGEKEVHLFEIKVFSKEPLNRMSGEKFFVTFSPHDFSVCYPVSKKKQ